MRVLSTPVLLATGVLAGSLLAAAPTTAAPIEKGHIVDVFTSDVYDCDGLVTAQDSGTVHVHYLGNLRGSSPFPYFSENLRGTVVTTNLDTGGTFTQKFAVHSHDQSIVDNGDGTITITVSAAGVARYYDQFGNFVLKDPGSFSFSFVVDYAGTPGDPSDDVEVPDTLQVVRPSTGNSDFSNRSFCEDLAMFTAAP